MIRSNSGRVLSVGEHLRSARRTRGWSLRQAEDASGVSNGYISQIERGEVEPSPAVLEKLSKAYDIPYEVVMEAAGYIAPRSQDESLVRAKVPAHVFRTMERLNEEEWEIAQNLMESLVKAREARERRPSE